MCSPSSAGVFLNTGSSNGATPSNLTFLSSVSFTSLSSVSSSSDPSCSSDPDSNFGTPFISSSSSSGGPSSFGCSY